MRRLLPSLLALSLVAASCSSGPAAETTTTTTAPPVASTAAPDTTSTTASPSSVQVEVEGAPAELTGLVASYYGLAAGSDEGPTALPRPLAPPPGSSVPATLTGRAATAGFAGEEIAVVAVGDDVLAAVDDGTGWRLVGGSVPSLGLAPYWGAFPRLVAVIGSDARPGENAERARADSLHVVGLDGEGGAGVVGIPRDSYVPVPGRGRSKINAALAFGGPELMMETLEDTSGLDIEGYVLTGFEGFQEMLGNVLGGINLEIPFAIVDAASGAAFRAGETYLNGPNALAFARARKTVPGGDFTRQLHGGLVIIGSLAFAKLKGPLEVPGLISGSEPWMSTDLSPEQLLTFSLASLETDVTAIGNAVLPGRAGSAGGGSVVFLSDSYQDVFADLADGRLDEEW